MQKVIPGRAAKVFMCKKVVPVESHPTFERDLPARATLLHINRALVNSALDLSVDRHLDTPTTPMLTSLEM